MKIYKQAELNVFFIESVSDAPVSDIVIERNDMLISIWRPRLMVYDIKDVLFSEIQDVNGNTFATAAACETYLNSQLGITTGSGGVGPQGPAGPKGEQGDKGDVGATGAAGPQGIKGDQGATGPVGIQGPSGAAGAVGPMGPAGPAGVAGPNGPSGAVGPQGVKGDTGNTGNTGPSGSQGPQGPIGLTGPQGPAGVSPAHYAKRLATTGTTGIINVTFPTGLFTAVPVVSCDVECPSADASSWSYRCEFIGAPTTTSCQIRVTRQSTTLVVSLLGSLITTIVAAPAGIVVNVIATDAST